MRLLLGLLTAAAFFFLPSVAGAQVTDSFVVGEFAHFPAAGGSHKLAVPMPTGTDLLLVCLRIQGDNVNDTTVTVTWRDVGLTQLNTHGTVISAVSRLLDCWQEISPTAGLDTVIVSKGDSIRSLGIVVGMFDNVNTTTPLGAWVAESGVSGASSDIDVAAATNDLCFDIVGTSGTISAITAGAGQTAVWSEENVDAGSVAGMASVEAGSATCNMAWTWTGNRTPSHLGVAVKVAGSPPNVPTNLSALPGLTSVTLNWQDNATDEDYQEIARCTGGACTPSVRVDSLAANVETDDDTGLTSNTTYGYGVRACKTGANCSAYSATLYVTTNSPGATKRPGISGITHLPCITAIDGGCSQTFGGAGGSPGFGAPTLHSVTPYADFLLDQDTVGTLIPAFFGAYGHGALALNGQRDSARIYRVTKPCTFTDCRAGAATAGSLFAILTDSIGASPPTGRVNFIVFDTTGINNVNGDNGAYPMRPRTAILGQTAQGIFTQGGGTGIEFGNGVRHAYARFLSDRKSLGGSPLTVAGGDTALVDHYDAAWAKTTDGGGGQWKVSSDTVGATVETYGITLQNIAVGQAAGTRGAHMAGSEPRPEPSHGHVTLFRMFQSETSHRNPWLSSSKDKGVQYLNFITYDWNQGAGGPNKNVLADIAYGFVMPGPGTNLGGTRPAPIPVRENHEAACPVTDGVGDSLCVASFHVRGIVSHRNSEWDIPPDSLWKDRANPTSATCTGTCSIGYYNQATTWDTVCTRCNPVGGTIDSVIKRDTMLTPPTILIPYDSVITRAWADSVLWGLGVLSLPEDLPLGNSAHLDSLGYWKKRTDKVMERIRQNFADSVGQTCWTQTTCLDPFQNDSALVASEYARVAPPHSDRDADGDGMPVAWEELCGLDTLTSELQVKDIFGYFTPERFWDGSVNAGQRLVWSSVPGATTYEVEADTLNAGAGPFVLRAQVDGDTTYVDPRGRPKWVYRVQVEGGAAGGTITARCPGQ